MTIYVDSSALVKRYALEEWSERVEDLVVAHRFATARFSLVEIASALARKTREGQLEPMARDRLFKMLGADISRAILVEMNSEVTREAQRLLFDHVLRAGDSVQLASAKWLRDKVPSIETFVCFDERLSRAARGEGFTVLDGTEAGPPA